MITDVRVINRQLEVSNTLQTPIYLSLFSWARAQPGDGVLDAAEQYGWWGDAYADVPGDEFGSRLWTLFGRRVTAELLAKAELLATEALQWMVDDGLVTSLQVRAFDVGENFVGLTISGAAADASLDTAALIASVEFAL